MASKPLLEAAAQPTTEAGSQVVADGALPIWLDFISSIVSSIVWPSIVIVVILLFRRSLTNALLNLRSVKYGDAEATFSTELREAKETAKAIEPVAPDVADANKARLVELVDMAAASPSGAILEAWKDVEQTVRSLAENRGLPVSNFRYSALETEKFLRQEEILPSAELQTLRELRTLRNRAAHENDGITVEQAREYVRIADRLVDAIRSILQGLGDHT